MKTKVGLVLSLLLFLNPAIACNLETGEREQLVQVSVDGEGIEGFLTIEEINEKIINLQGGGSITISVIPASDDQYKEVLSRSTAWKYTTELVSLSVSGETGAGNKIEMGSLAGANSLQIFQSVGDSEQEVEILLLKQVCVGPSVEKNN